MAQLTPYLTYGGNCKEAFDYYQRHIGATDVQVMTFRGSPMEPDTPEHWRDKVMHACLQVGGSMLMASDCMPGQPFDGMKNVSIVLHAGSDADARRLFDALAAGGTITMPLGPTFWATSFGMCTDQFGAGWMVMHERPQ